MNQRADIPEVQAGPWVVIWAESRAEKKVEKRMAALGLSPWLPVVKERHRWSDRWREVECPLFPGYLFARATNADWHQILRTPGVLTVVKEGGKPALLAGSFVTALRDAIGRQLVIWVAEIGRGWRSRLGRRWSSRRTASSPSFTENE